LSRGIGVVYNRQYNKMYYDSYNGFELAAKKAYHEEEWTSSEDDIDNGPPGSEMEMH
jgi:hypothetical protein